MEVGGGAGGAVAAEETVSGVEVPEGLAVQGTGGGADGLAVAFDEINRQRGVFQLRRSGIFVENPIPEFTSPVGAAWFRFG